MLPRIVDIYETAEAIYVVEDFVEGIKPSYERPLALKYYN